MPRTGKGAYIYLPYAFFRQMPEGVPGGFASWPITQAREATRAPTQVNRLEAPLVAINLQNRESSLHWEPSLFWRYFIQQSRSAPDSAYKQEAGVSTVLLCDGKTL